MSSKYLTIQAPAEGIYKEKMSKFLSFAVPVETVDSAMSVIMDFQKRYFDARHVCWAYMLGADRAAFRSNDNGEPSGTAGKPILGQINSMGLTNLVVIVVRYFGGIKLGTSGLIAAYRAAAREALEAATFIESCEMAALSVVFPYVAMNDVMKILKNDEIKIVGQHFDNTCRIDVKVPADKTDYFSTLISSASGASVSGLNTTFE